MIGHEPADNFTTLLDRQMPHDRSTHRMGSPAMMLLKKLAKTFPNATPAQSQWGIVLVEKLAEMIHEDASPFDECTADELGIPADPSALASVRQGSFAIIAQTYYELICWDIEMKNAFGCTNGL
jgi:hypothetical protein